MKKTENTSSLHACGFRLRMGRVLTLSVGLLTAGCASFGPDKVVSSHLGYNEAVQQTITREVLANIVRTRYVDPIQFLSVSAINAQFSVSTGASAGVGGIGAAGAAGDVGGSIGYSDSPTITYLPQSDAGFYKSLYAPFSVGEAVGFGLAYRSSQIGPDWNTLSLVFSFASINGADDFVGGVSNPLYRRRVDAMARLLQLGATYQQVPEWDFDSVAIEKERVTSEDMVRAFRMGLSFIEEDGGERVRLARYRMVLALTLPNPDDPKAIEALNTLGVQPGRSQYILRPPSHATPGESDPHAIWVWTRSMSGVLNLACRFVVVPTDHSSIVPTVTSLDGDAWKLPSIQIRSSATEPPDPYRVEHRGYWFYVDDTDIESKVFLDAMVVAYLSRVGSYQAGDAAPEVVIPIGGG